MAYQIDQNTGDIVINGFEQGIGESPYSGLTDMRNMNIVSVPGEAAVNFSTSNIASGAITGSITSATGSIATFTGGTGMENYIAIYFTSTDSYSGFSTATPYWVGNLSGSTFQLYKNYAQTDGVTFGGTGTAPFVAYRMGYAPSFVSGGGGLVGGIKQFASPINIVSAGYYTFGVDSAGLVWGNVKTTGTNSYWTYTGNSIVNGSNIRNASGNGLVYWRVSNGLTGASSLQTDYLFALRNSQIDYFVVKNNGSGGPTTLVWTSGWNPSDGTTGGSAYLTTPEGFTGSHMGITSYDGRVYFCDGANIQKIYQTSPTTIFNPTNTATFTFLTFNLLPINDSANCLAPFSTNILIGGLGSTAYQWNTTSNLVSNYIPIAEPYISQIVTVNTNSYIFAGSRGRIYITNGSQAQEWLKIPDHLTNTIEPLYQWGGACSVKNQLYFSFLTQAQDASSLGVLGGVWAVDLNTKAVRISNQLSYGTYAGYATALIPKIYNPSFTEYQYGSSLFMGWYDGVTSCGIDIPSTSRDPYTGGQAYVVSDMIPIGTTLKPITPSQVEAKFSVPLKTGESVQLSIASSLSSNTNPTFTSLGTITGNGSVFSANFPATLQNLQWVMVKAVSTGIAFSSSPSYNRLKEIRIIK